jgi:hypothetical protein
MGNSSLVEVVNDEVVSLCKSLMRMLNDDTNEGNEFIDEEKVRFIRRIDGKFYNAEEKINF